MGASSVILFIGPRPHVRTSSVNERDLCREFIFDHGADLVLNLQIAKDLLRRQHLAQFRNKDDWSSASAFWMPTSSAVSFLAFSSVKVFAS